MRVTDEMVEAACAAYENLPGEKEWISEWKMRAAIEAALAAAPQAEPVAKVELMTTGGNAGLATRIVEIDDHLRERLRPGQLLYTAPPASDALREAARMALDFCEFCWRDVALNEFAEERRAGVEHRLREALGDER